MSAQPEVGVVDYGAGNLFSVTRGLSAAGCRFRLVGDPDGLAAPDAVLLPGVGAFGAGMGKLREVGLDQAVLAYAASGRPVLGICLGMQMLMTESREFGRHAGLNLISGTVEEMPQVPGWPLPNIGWSPVSLAGSVQATPFEGIVDGTDFYFAHSFHCVPSDATDVLATIDYGGRQLAVLIGRGNVFGCQFHPEISDVAGLMVLSALQSLT